MLRLRAIKDFYVGRSCCKCPYRSFRKLGVPYFGVLITRILLFRVLDLGPLFSENPILTESRKGCGCVDVPLKLCSTIGALITRTVILLVII